MKEKKVYLLIEMGSFMRQDPTEPDFMDFFRFIQIVTSRHKNVYCIISSSSGCGWSRGPKFRSSAADKEIDRVWKKLCDRFTFVSSQNFTDAEAASFMTVNSVSSALSNELSTFTGWNPLLLTHFGGLSSVDDNDFEDAMARSERDVDDVIVDLLDVKDQDLFEEKLVDCDKWLTYAQNSFPIDKKKKKAFRTSYVSNENLVYLKESNVETFTLGLGFPTLCSRFLGYLKQCFVRRSKNYLKSDLVQGLMFKEYFLMEQRTLHVEQKLRTGETKHLLFNFQEPLFQLEGLLTEMTMGELYYLHLGHVAIDGVCAAKEATSNIAYLLLIQVSLSPYINHHSKARDCCTTKLAENFTVAEYYSKFVSVDENNVIYVYASPTQPNYPKTMVMPTDTVYTVGTITVGSSTWNDILVAEELARREK